MEETSFRGMTEADAEPMCAPSSHSYQDGQVSVTIGQATNVVHGSLTIIQKKSSKSKSKKTVRRPQKPLTESQEKLSMDQKVALRERMGKVWKDVGRYLGFDDGQLEQMEVMHPDMEERNYQLLRRWEQEKDNLATRAFLADILANKLKRGDLADLLADS